MRLGEFARLLGDECGPLEKPSRGGVSYATSMRSRSAHNDIPAERHREAMSAPAGCYGVPQLGAAIPPVRPQLRCAPTANSVVVSEARREVHHTVNYREHANLVGTDLIQDSIPKDEDLANRGIAGFGNHTTPLREFREGLCRGVD